MKKLEILDKELVKNEESSNTFEFKASKANKLDKLKKAFKNIFNFFSVIFNFLYSLYNILSGMLQDRI